jgi:hypothetical protein
MILETVAAGAVAILSPYLAEAGKGFAKKAGESLAEKATSLYDTIKAKFKGDPDAEQALSLVEAKPESKGRQMTLEELLVERMDGDADFAKTVGELVEEAKKADARNVIVFGNRNIAAGDVKDSTFIAGDQNIVNRS